MAVMKFYPVAGASVGTSAGVLYAATLGASGTSGVITTGPDMLIRIVATGAITVRFGASATITAAGAGDMLIPANTIDIWDMGHLNNAITIFSIAATTTITVSQVVKN
jgi:hypothetical protein